MELTHELHHEFPNTKGVEVYIHPLFEEEKGQSSHHDDARKELYHKLWDISERLEDYGLLQKSTPKHLVKTSRCIADNDNCLIVTPGGKLGKCEHYSEDHFVGHINNDNFDQNVIGNFKSLHEEIEACKTCFYYPNCIWLNLCPNNKNCYPEIREDKIRKVRRGILTIYKNFKKQA
jgi:radical SAM protein with 4Fe4S-binding SPASM domain